MFACVFLQFLLQVVHWLFPDFAFMWLVEEAKKNLPLELDFLNEGRNAEKIADMLRKFNFLKVCENVSLCGIGEKLLIVFGYTAAYLNVLIELRPNPGLI